MVIVDSRLSAKFANMSIVCAFLVVCMHVGVGFAIGSTGWWVSELTRNGVSRIAVPFFFLASGFFLAGHVCEQGWWWREPWKRVRTLLVPLMIWPLIWMFWGAPFTMIANRLAGRPIGYMVPFMNGIWWPGVGVLWFIRFLFILVVLSPVLVWLLRRLGCLWVVFAFGVYWCVLTFLDPVAPKGPLAWCVYQFSLEGLAYFSLGLWLRLGGEGYDDCPCERGWCGWLDGVVAGCSIVLIVASVLCLQKWGGGGAYNIKHYHIPFTMLTMWRLMPEVRFPSVLVSAALPVYLMHCGCAIPVAICLKRLPWCGDLTCYLIRWFAAFGLSVLVAWGVRKFLPRTANVLFGGR